MPIEPDQDFIKILVPCPACVDFKTMCQCEQHPKSGGDCYACHLYSHHIVEEGELVQPST